MGWDGVATLWDDLNSKDKVPSTSKECFGDTENNVDVDDRHTDGYAVNVDHGQIYGHAYTCTWYDVVSRGTIIGRNVQL